MLNEAKWTGNAPIYQPGKREISEREFKVAQTKRKVQPSSGNLSSAGSFGCWVGSLRL